MAQADYQLNELLKLEELEKARRGLLSFTLFTKDDYRVNWHHQLICQYLNKFIRGEIKRLMIFCPPRHGKSELVSRRLPAMLMGINPNAQIISASYSDNLASMMNRDTQRIIDSPEYQTLFPDTSLAKSVGGSIFTRNSDVFEIVGHKGRYKSAGIGTGITGMGANYAIIDDPVKDQIDADSEVKRENVWEWYTSTLYTRLQNPRSILLTMTRWHEDDLAGRLLQQAKKDPTADQWEVLSLPAICEPGNDRDPRKEGEELWPSDFNADAMRSIRASVGPRVWSALYQQSPMPPGGGLFENQMFDFVDPLSAYDYSFVMADTAYKEKQENDFNVFTYFGVKDGEMYIDDVLRLRVKASEIEAPVLKFILPKQIYGFRGCYIEPKGHGIYLNQTLPTKGVLIPTEKEIAEFFNDRRLDKVQRANNAIPHLRTRKIRVNKNLNNVDELMREILSFPRSKHDDFVDTVIDGVKFVFGKTLGILDVL